MADYAKQPRRKYCQFCKDDVEYIDYKDTQMLRKYVTDRGKIKPRRVTGACTQHQRDIAEAVKRAATARRREENHESYSSEGTPGQRRRG